MKIQEILNQLRAPIPQSAIATKRIKGVDISYVPWYRLCDLLSQRTGGLWDWSVSLHFNNGKTIIVGTLAIEGDDRAVARQATGQEDDDIDGYGDPTSNAEAMAFRRCCAKFGLGIDLYEKSKPTSTASKPTPKTYTHTTKYGATPSRLRSASLKEEKPWKAWKSPEDALIWAKTQLPNWDEDAIQEAFEGLPDSNGKKAIAWTDWVRRRAAFEQEMLGGDQYTYTA